MNGERFLQAFLGERGGVSPPVDSIPTGGLTPPRSPGPYLVAGSPS